MLLSHSHAEGTYKRKVAETNAKIRQHLERIGFVIHDVFGQVTRHRSLGYILDGKA